MIPILDRDSVAYLKEENALLKDACIRERMRSRGTVILIDKSLAIAKKNNHVEVIEALMNVRHSIDL